MLLISNGLNELSNIYIFAVDVTCLFLRVLVAHSLLRCKKKKFQFLNFFLVLSHSILIPVLFYFCRSENNINIS